MIRETYFHRLKGIFREYEEGISATKATRYERKEKVFEDLRLFLTYLGGSGFMGTGAAKFMSVKGT